MDIGIILLLLLLFYKRKEKTSNIFTTEGENISYEFENKTKSLNIPYTKEKINILKNIGIYFPEELIPLLNKSIFITEKIIKLFETMEFINISNISYIDKPIPVENNKERLSYIINTIQKEFPKENTQNIGTILDIIINMDKYKAIFSSLNTITSNPDNLKDPNQILHLLEPLLEGVDEKEKDKIREMAKILGLMNNLENTKKVELNNK
ncbi:MAG: hypothetical protein GX023_07475 [Tissierellia bacterium]|nr:hypothetical protein [Tissierellia bacterium]